MITLQATTINAIKESDLTCVLPHLSAKTSDKFQRVLRRRAAVQSVIGEILVRTYYHWILPQPTEFTYNDAGKPSIQNHPEFYFNISHSDECVAAAFADGPIGLDVEKIRTRDEAVITSFYSSAERQMIGQAPPELRDYLYYKIWTIKEAYGKAIGTGIPKIVRGLSSIIENEASRVAQQDRVVEGWHISTHNLSGNYVASICKQLSNQSVTIEQIVAQELLEQFKSQIA
ncbi:MAG: 4'-phosphopantetheinyl transferase superfamily protein [Chitinivibrionales bacterium]|nr:4'-phosphopantetheinyl transferase superfamily protein [Chitinivibrionales bacterium]